jgi:hypothetical protein
MKTLTLHCSGPGPSPDPRVASVLCEQCCVPRNPAVSCPILKAVLRGWPRGDTSLEALSSCRSVQTIVSASEGLSVGWWCIGAPVSSPFPVSP